MRRRLTSIPSDHGFLFKLGNDVPHEVVFFLLSLRLHTLIVSLHLRRSTGPLGMARVKQVDTRRKLCLLVESCSVLSDELFSEQLRQQVRHGSLLLHHLVDRLCALPTGRLLSLHLLVDGALFSIMMPLL